jgi:putative membrane protein
MPRFLIKFVVSFFALGFTAAIIRGIDIVGASTADRAIALGLAALVLGLLNAVIRPILVFLTLPITILSLGLFIFVLNGLLIWATSKLVHGFVVTGIGPAILGAILMTVISFILNHLIKEPKERRG